MGRGHPALLSWTPDIRRCRAALGKTWRFHQVGMRLVGLRAIHAYQRYISPHKGFCCAYRSITGRQSCSSFSARAIKKAGILGGIRLTLRRLQRCSSVYAQILKSPNRPTQFAQLLKRQAGHCDFPIEGCHASDMSNLSDCACNCVPGPCDLWRPRRKQGREFGTAVRVITDR